MSIWDRITGRAALQEQITQMSTTLQEATSKLSVTEQRLEEVSAFAGMYDPDLNLTAAQGGSAYMRKLTQAARDLPQLQHEKMIKLAYWLYEMNPVARRILSTTSAYIIGDGFKASAHYEEKDANGKVTGQDQQEEIQNWIDRFWNDHINLIDLNLPKYTLQLGMWGELILICNVNPVDGLVRLASVDPERVDDVLFDKGEPIAIQLKPEFSGPKERLKVIRIVEDPNSDAYGRLMPAESENGKTTETWQELDVDGNPKGEARAYLGSCFFFRVNNVSGAKRGRSDLLSVIDWLDAYDKFMFDEVERTSLLKAFVWEITLNGMTEPQIEAWLKKNASPRAGALRAHNEGAKWDAVTPDLKVQDSRVLGEMLLATIATGAQYPKTWLNITEDVNRATGQVLDEPTFRWMSARQRYIRYIVEQLVTFQLDQAEMAGEISKRETQPGSISPVTWEITIDVSELRTRDLSAAADTLSKAISALVLAVPAHYLDEETAQRIAVMLAEQLGVDIDIDVMRDRIEKAKAEKEAEMVPPVLPPDSGDPNAPGGPPGPQGPTRRQLFVPGPPTQRRPALATGRGQGA